METLKFLFFYLLYFLQIHYLFLPKIKYESVPLINLEELSPTFEEDKDELEKIDQNVNLNNIENSQEENKVKKDEKIYINIKALDKITAKTSCN